MIETDFAASIAKPVAEGFSRVRLGLLLMVSHAQVGDQVIITYSGQSGDIRAMPTDFGIPRRRQIPEALCDISAWFDNVHGQTRNLPSILGVYPGDNGRHFTGHL